MVLILLERDTWKSSSPENEVLSLYLVFWQESQQTQDKDPSQTFESLIS